jgi:outer membrane receptor protein involved in Fe transport
MYRKVLVVITVFLVLPALVFAGTTGKIKGKVSDRENGEALPAANVTIVGTTLGAAADLNGEYVILNVPVGTYSVRASYIGYQAITISNIKVAADLTTEVDFPLPTEAMAVGSVEIVAERPLVNKNATNAVRIATQEDVAKLPLRNVTQYVALAPGITVLAGNIHIRGGRKDEVGYYVEGASTRSPLSGDNLVNVIPDALEEFQVQAGGYNAEYGGANAGIIRQTLRSGTNDYRATLQVETDNFAGKFPNEQFLDTYSYGYWDYTGTFSGPLLNKKLKFFLAGQNTFLGDRYQLFWPGFTVTHNSTGFVNSSEFPLRDSGLRGGTAGDSIAALVVKPGNIPEANLNRFVGNGTLIFEYKPVIVRLAAALTFQNQQNNGGNPIRNIFNEDRIPQTDVSTGLYNLKFTHLLGSKTFYEVNLNYFDRRSVGYDPLFRENFYLAADSLAEAAKGYTLRDYTLPKEPYDFYGFPFNRPGTYAGYGKNKLNYVGGSFDLTSQYRSHEIKFGASYQRYTFRSFDLGVGSSMTLQRSNPDLIRRVQAGDEEAIGLYSRSAFVNAIGYDVFGNESDEEGLFGPKNPQFFSAYVQDKFEAKDLVINAGLRFDTFDNDDFEFLDANDPGFRRSSRTIIEDSTRKKDTFTQFSPRLGLAFPVTDRTVFHLQYGKFIQSPKLDDLYRGRSSYAILFSGGNYVPNAPGFGVDPERTTQYEVGFSQQFSDVAAFDITGFYKDIKGQIQISKITTDPGANAAAYNFLTNGDFATTKGLEFTLTLRRTNRVSGRVNYTLADSRGTGSSSNFAVGGIEFETQLPTVISPLDFQNTHRGAINFDYRFDKGDGGPILQELGLNVLVTFNSGHPYTRIAAGIGQQGVDLGGQVNDERSRRPLEAINSSTTPWNFNLDLRLDKTVDFGRFGANFYVYAQNLTNRQNVLNVYARTGNAFDDGFLSDPLLSGSVIAAAGGPGAAALYEFINLGHQQNWRSSRIGAGTYGEMFGTPRQIRVGVKLEY